MLASAAPIEGFGTFGSLTKSRRFQARFGESGGSAAWRSTQPGQPSGGEAPDDAEPVDPIEQAARDAFLQGFREGERVTREAQTLDEAARADLATAIGQIAQSGEGALATMLSQAVSRLVGQIIGEVPIDETLLQERCTAVAAYIGGDEAQAVLEVNPQDMPLLDGAAMGVTLAPNPELSRGSVRLATADGWVEDGPDVRLARLKTLMDDMEGRR